MIHHAIVGCGRVAPNHVYGVQQSKEAVLTHLCDLDRSKAVAFGVTTARVSSNVNELIDDPSIDSVSICTDHGSHAQLAHKFLAAGKHVLIEKPVCIHPAEAQSLLRAAEERPNQVISVVAQHRYNRLLVAVKEQVDQGIFGRICKIHGSMCCTREESYYSGWRGKLATEGGSALINQGIHILDQMVWFGGRVLKAEALQATLKFDNIETEDTIASVLLFERGTIGTISCTTTTTLDWLARIEIVGTEGLIVLSLGFPAQLVTIDLPRSPKVVEKLKEVEKLRTPLPPGIHYYGASHSDQIENFFRAISKQEQLHVSLREGVETWRVVNLIYESSRKG